MSDASASSRPATPALIVEFEERIDPAVNARAIALAEAVAGARVSPASATSCRRIARSRSISIRCARTTTALIDRAARSWRRGDDRVAGAAAATPIRAFRCATAASSARTWPTSRAFARLTRGRGRRAARRPRSIASSCSGSCPGFAYMGTVDAAHRRAAPRDAARCGCRPDRSASPARRPASIRRRRPAAGRSSAARRSGRSISSRRDAVSVQGQATPCSSTRSTAESIAAGRRDGRALRAHRRRAADDRAGSRAAGACRRAACRWPGRWIRASHRLANALVGNDSDAATLEVTLDRPGAGVRRRAARGGRRRASSTLDVDGRPAAAERAVRRRAPDARLRFGARGARRARVPGGRRRDRGAAGARQPRDASRRAGWAGSTAAR